MFNFTIKTSVISVAYEALCVSTLRAVCGFMNRCDYLDPALAWVGVKDSGHGCTLSRLGYGYLTRPKSFHLRTVLA
jgi:hypothetical protein